MSGLLERLGVELPVVQAGMGGGIAGHELAAAVSGAGGLGTLGHAPPGLLRSELRAARERSDRPLAVNLLQPFARGGHWEAAEHADVVVTFWGRPRRRTSKPWLHQCGSVEEALAARGAGADGVIAQGVEAGGHVRGVLSAPELLERVRAALPEHYPVLAAGGIAGHDDVERALAAGAEAAVAGTRFVLTEESGAHPGYRRRVLDAERTLLIELFGFGWPGMHRVVPNRATERWLGGGTSVPSWLRALNRATAPLASRVPADVHSFPARLQRPGVPILSPLAAHRDAPDRMLDALPLYAGESALRIHEVVPAAAATSALAKGDPGPSSPAGTRSPPIRRR